MKYSFRLERKNRHEFEEDATKENLKEINNALSKVELTSCELKHEKLGVYTQFHYSVDESVADFMKMPVYLDECTVVGADDDAGKEKGVFQIEIADFIKGLEYYDVNHLIRKWSEQHPDRKVCSVTEYDFGDEVCKTVCIILYKRTATANKDIKFYRKVHFKTYSETREYIDSAKDGTTLPLGISVTNGVPRLIDLQKEFSFIVTGAARTGRTNALMCIGRTFAERGAQIYVVCAVGNIKWQEFCIETGAELVDVRQPRCSELFSKELAEKYLIPRKQLRTKSKDGAEIREVFRSFKPVVILADDTDILVQSELPYFDKRPAECIGWYGAADAESLGVYTFVAVSREFLTVRGRRMPMFNKIIPGMRGIVLGGEFDAANVWLTNTDIDRTERNKTLSAGAAYLLIGEHAEQITFPLCITNKLTDNAEKLMRLHASIYWHASKNWGLSESAWYPAYLDDIKDFLSQSFADGKWLQKGCRNIAITFCAANDVMNKRYIAITCDITCLHNIMIVGPEGAGKTMAVQTMVVALCRRYSPAEVNIYVFGSGLDLLSDFPQVCDAIYKADPNEVIKLLHRLQEITDTRKALFEQKEAEKYAAFHNINFATYNDIMRHNNKPVLSAVVVFVDGIEQIHDAIGNDDALWESFVTMLGTGSDFGIYFVVTSLDGTKPCLRTKPCRPLHGFSCIALQQRNLEEYSEVLGVRVPFWMDRIPDRAGDGMIVVDDKLYEMRVLLPAKANDESKRNGLLRTLAADMRAAWHGELPRDTACSEKPGFEAYSQTQEYIASAQDGTTLPLGYSLMTGKPRLIDLQNEFSFIVTGEHKTGRTNALMCIGKTFAQRGAEIYVMGSSEWKPFCEETGARLIDPEKPECRQLFERDLIDNVLKPRKQQRTESGDKTAVREVFKTFKPVVILLDDVDTYILKEGFTGRPAECIGFIGAADAASLGVYTFAAVTSNELARNIRKSPLGKLSFERRGIVLGGKLNDADVWNIRRMNFMEKQEILPSGTAQLVIGDTVEQIMFPLVVKD